MSLSCRYICSYLVSDNSVSYSCNLDACHMEKQQKFKIPQWTLIYGYWPKYLSHSLYTPPTEHLLQLKSTAAYRPHSACLPAGHNPVQLSRIWFPAVTRAHNLAGGSKRDFLIKRKETADSWQLHPHGRTLAPLTCMCVRTAQLLNTSIFVGSFCSAGFGARVAMAMIDVPCSRTAIITVQGGDRRGWDDCNWKQRHPNDAIRIYHFFLFFC